MIHTKDYYGQANNLNEMETGFTDAVSNAFDEGMALNPTKLLTDWNAKHTGSDDMVNAEEAMAIGEKMGVSLRDVPSSISREAATMLAERQYQAQKRDEFAQSGPSGIKGLGASLTGNIAASFLDPIGLAVNFIPFVGPAKYSAMLAKAGTSYAARLGVRAAVGAIEGAAGNALIEPLVYGAATDLNENYSLADSAMSIGAGAVMGAAIHSVVGLPTDLKMHFDGIKERGKVAPPELPTERPPNETPLSQEELATLNQADERTKYQRDLEARQLKEFEEYRIKTENNDNDRLSHKDGDELATAAAAQAANGNNIDVNPIRNLQDANRTLRFDEAKKLDPIAFKILESSQDNTLALKEFKDNLSRRYDSSAPVQTAERIVEIQKQLDNAEKLSLTGKQVAELQDELSALRGYEGSKSFLSDLDKLDNLDKQIEFINQELDRVALKPEIHERVSNAYREAGKRLDSGRNPGVVKAKKTDAYLEAFAEGRAEMPTIKRDNDPGFDVDVAKETKAHTDNFTDPKKHELYDQETLDTATKDYEDLKTNEPKNSEEVYKKSMEDLDVIAAQYGLKGKDLLSDELLKEIKEFPETLDALQKLLPCVMGVK